MAAVEGSSEDLHKCATAINDLAHKVWNLDTTKAQETSSEGHVVTHKKRNKNKTLCRQAIVCRAA